MIFAAAVCLFVCLLIPAETQLVRKHCTPVFKKRCSVLRHGDGYCVWSIKVARYICQVPFPLIHQGALNETLALMRQQLCPCVTTFIISDHFLPNSVPHLLPSYVATTSWVSCSQSLFQLPLSNCHFDEIKQKKDPDAPFKKRRRTIHSSTPLLQLPTRDVGWGGSWGDVALVLAVKWSICRYVGLHHSHPLSHSLLRSPDEQKRLIYSGFKDVAFFSNMTLLPRGVCLSLWIPTKHSLMASLRLTWVNYILLERKKSAPTSWCQL